MTFLFQKYTFTNLQDFRSIQHFFFKQYLQIDRLNPGAFIPGLKPGVIHIEPLRGYFMIVFHFSLPWRS